MGGIEEYACNGMIQFNILRVKNMDLKKNGCE
jgi:hypothetical protein